MSILFSITKILSRFRLIRFTQANVLIGGIIVLILLSFAVLAWDTYLFLQSISPPQVSTSDLSKKDSLTSQTIDEGIDILNQHKKQFDTLLQNITSSSTISF